MNNEITLAWMYPDVLNLHGERANAQCFKMVADQLGIALNIDRIDNLEEDVDFSTYDIMLFNAGELKVVPDVVKSIERQKEEFTKYVNDKKYIIVTGTTGALLADTVTRKNGEIFYGLKLLNMDVKERPTVIGDDLYYSIEDGTEIMGCQIQMIDIELKENQKALGTIKYGYGNSGKTDEGAIKDNIVFSNCLGPLFVKNPWYTEKILRDICSKKQISISEDIKPNYEIELKSLESTKEFINKKIENK